MIVTMFPEPREQPKAIGVYTFVAVAGGSIGLLLGGVLTDLINWHWIFFVNLPIGVATGLYALRVVEDRPGLGLEQGSDLPGALTLTGGLMLLVDAIVDAGEQGWGSTPVDASYARDILPSTVLLGLGTGLAFPSLMTLAMSGATPSDSGLASGLVNTSAQVGGALDWQCSPSTVANALNSGFTSPT